MCKCTKRLRTSSFENSAESKIDLEQHVMMSQRLYFHKITIAKIALDMIMSWPSMVHNDAFCRH